jgi:hypothetical protein
VDETHPTAAPATTALHHILLPSKDTTQTFSAANIKTDPAFVGPYIGFALTKDYDNDPTTDPTPIYYSEYQRNAYCTDCATPGNWITALAYQATSRSDTYYLAFEDWEGANESKSSWMNDGDFNDKVFKLVGISCAGGGIACQVPGAVGLCAVGVSECATNGGTPGCTALYTAREETCDAVDNDCDGETDEGDLCATNEICVKGNCVFDCGGGEFICPTGYECGNDNYCIESACVNVECELGKACRNGVCADPCTGIVCPLDQTCVDGSCLNVCSTKVCPTGSVCDPSKGACVGTCGCTACGAGKECDLESGFCVDPGCTGVKCAAHQGCVNGSCVDACAGAVCPGGAACTDGTCGAPRVTTTGGSGSDIDGGLIIGSDAGSNGSSGGHAGIGGTGTVDGSNKNGSSILSGDDSGCGCRISHPRTRPTLTLLSFGSLLLAACRKRRRR